MSWKVLIKKEGDIDSDLFERYINASITSTGQAEFYTSESEQAKGLRDLHNEMLEKEREIYALSLLLPINDFSKQLVAYNLLKHSKELDKDNKKYENRIIFTALNRMPTNRAYKVFSILARNKVNNERSRFMARLFLNSRPRLLDEAIKYRKWMHDLAVHNHIKPSEKNREIFDFIFKKKKTYKNELLNAYTRAKKHKDDVFKLPYSIALGFKELHKIPDKEFYQKIRGGMTKGEKLRAQNVAAKAGVKVEADLAEYTPEKLLKYLRVEKTNKSRDELFRIFSKACKKVADTIPFRFDKIRAVIDNSNSMCGSSAKKNHPISVAESVAQVSKYLGNDVKIIAVPNKGEFLSEPIGRTNLAEGILDALEDEPDLLLIISDGYSNAPAGLAEQVLEIYKKKIDRENKTIILHINPVFSPESKDIKKLSKLVQTCGIRETRQLFILLLLTLIKHKKTKEIEEVIEDLRKKVVEIKTTDKKKREKAA